MDCHNGKLTHEHRIVPGYQGGKYEEGNVVEIHTVRHAMWHFANWKLWGNPEDRIAWRGLAGIVTHEEAVFEACSLGGKRGGPKGGRNQPIEVKREICKKMRKHLTKDALQRAGRNGPPDKHKKAGRVSALKSMKMVELIRIEDGEVFIFESATFAGQCLGISHGNISNVCNGKRSKVQGYTARWLC
jgi:hypothetical protein